MCGCRIMTGISQKRKMADNKIMAERVLQTVGGKENVLDVTHCMTRLRFRLKDETIAKDDEIKKIDGVLGVVRNGGQVQVVIGPQVAKVYEELQKTGSLSEKEPVKAEADESPSAKGKKKKTAIDVINNVIGALAGCLTPLIPILLCCGMAKMLASVLGPNLFNVLDTQSNLFILLTLVGDAGFYFLPVIIGYTAAKRFGMTPVMGMLFGAILVHPTLVKLAADGTAFSVYGIPVSVQNYTSTVFPMFLTVWIGSYVEKFLRKHIPDTIQVIGVPLITLFVMLPVELSLCAPLGYYLGNGIATGLVALNHVAGPLAVAVLAGSWTLLVLCGMHVALVPFVVTSFATLGYDTFIVPAMFAGSWATFGCMLAVLVLVKDKKKRALYSGYVFAWLIGGVGEPYKYGVQIPYRTPLYASVISGVLTGLVAGFMHLTANVLNTANGIYSFAGFLGGDMKNYIALIVTTIAGTAFGFITMYVLKIDESLVE